MQIPKQHHSSQEAHVVMSKKDDSATEMAEKVTNLEECFPGEKIDNDWMKAKLQELGLPSKGRKTERLTRLFEFVYSEEDKLCFSSSDYEIEDVDSKHNDDELALEESDDDRSKDGIGNDSEDSSSDDVSPNLAPIADDPNEARPSLDPGDLTPPRLYQRSHSHLSTPSECLWCLGISGDTIAACWLLLSPEYIITAMLLFVKISNQIRTEEAVEF
jgi:hypothetical protein